MLSLKAISHFVTKILVLFQLMVWGPLCLASSDQLLGLQPQVRGRPRSGLCCRDPLLLPGHPHPLDAPAQVICRSCVLLSHVVEKLLQEASPLLTCYLQHNLITYITYLEDKIIIIRKLRVLEGKSKKMYL